MNTEFFEALAMLEEERGLESGSLLEKVKNALVIAVRRDYPGIEEPIVEIDPQKGLFHVAIVKMVVEEMTGKRRKNNTKRNNKKQ